jgi:hypothetical protein
MNISFGRERVGDRESASENAFLLVRVSTLHL